MTKRTSVTAFIRDIADRISQQSDYSDRQRTNASVELRKRLRNQTDSDRYGVFSPVNGVWTDDFDTGSLYSLNIVQPAIRTNTSAMMTAKVKIDVEPRVFKNAEASMAAQVASAIIEQKDRLQWTSALEEYIANEQQLGPGVFVRTRYNPRANVRKHQVPEWGEDAIQRPGQAVCGGCGISQEVTGGNVDDLGKCALCGGVMIIETAPTEETLTVMVGLKEFETGDTETRAIPFFEVRVDATKTQGGNLDDAKWFEHHFAASVDDLQVEYPAAAESLTAESTSEMSYSIRWQQALKQNRRTPAEMSSASVIDMCEVRDIFLTPSMYLNTTIDQNFALKNKDGSERFAVSMNETLADARFEGKAFDEAPVWCFRVVGTVLLDVFPCDFREEFAYISFLNDPSTFWGLYMSDLVVMQDIVNTALTLQMFHIRRNSITSIVYNSNAFDPESFGTDLIPTKDNVPIDHDTGSTFGILPALTLSAEPMQMLSTVMGLKSDVTLTTPAMMGQAQPGEPYRAQLLQKQSSLGLLAPAEISKADAKVKWATYQLKCAQRYWTEADTREMLMGFPEWTSDHIEAFLHCDIQKDVIIDYAEGSEIPQSLIEREIKLNQMFSSMMQLSQIAPQLIKPEFLNELVSRMISSVGIDVDFNNVEQSLRVAEGRYDKLVEAVRSVDGFDPQRDPEAAQAFVAEVLANPVFTPLIYEGHETEIEFYTDKQTGEMATATPNLLLIALCGGMIKMHEQAIVARNQTQAGIAAASQAPMEQAAQAQAAEQAQMQAQAAEQAQAQAQADKEGDRAHELAVLRERQNFEAMMKGADIEAKMRREEREEQQEKEARSEKPEEQTATATMV